MKKYILPGIAVVFSGVIIYQTYTIQSTRNKVESIEQQMMELTYINENLEQSIIDNVQTTLNDELGKSHLTKEVIFKLNKNVKEGYDLNVRAELKELKENTKVLFMYKEESANKWNQLDLEEIADLSYSGDFVLPFDKSYEYKIVLKGSTIESGDIEIIEKNQFMPEFPECNWYNNGEGLTLTAYDVQDKKYKIKKVEFIVSFNNKEKTYKAKYVEEPIYGEGNEISDYDIKYELEIPQKDYSGDVDYITAKVTYENGIVDLRNITNNRND